MHFVIINTRPQNPVLGPDRWRKFPGPHSSPVWSRNHFGEWNSAHWFQVTFRTFSVRHKGKVEACFPLNQFPLKCSFWILVLSETYLFPRRLPCQGVASHQSPERDLWAGGNPCKLFCCCFLFLLITYMGCLQAIVFMFLPIPFVWERESAHN